MISAISLFNPTSALTRISLSSYKTKISTITEELASGSKAIEDIITLVSSRMLQQSCNTLNMLKKNMSRNNSLLESAKAGCEQILDQIDNLQQIVDSANSQTDNSATLLLMQNKFSDQIYNLGNQINSINFEGIKLFTGNFVNANASSIQNFNISAPKLTYTTVGTSGNQGYAGTTGSAQGATIKISGNVNPGNNIILDNISFVFVTTPNSSPYQVQIGATAADTAQNLASAILNAPDLALKLYTIDLTTVDTITVSRALNVLTPVNVTTNNSSNITINAVAGSKAAIDVSNMTNSNLLLGSIRPSYFNAPDFAWGSGMTSDVCAGPNPLIDPISRPTVPSPVTYDGSEKGIAYKYTIGGFNYYGGYMGRGSVSATPANAIMRMRSYDGGGYFDINLGSANDCYNIMSATNYSQALNCAFTSLSGLIRLVFDTKFSQLKYLILDNVNQDITSYGKIIGSTTGISAFILTSNFSNLTFNDFTITPGTSTGTTTFTAQISNKNFVASNIPISSLIEGKLLTLVATDGSTDKFGLNIGNRGLINMTTTDRMALVQEAYKTVFGIGKGLTIKIGEKSDNIVNIGLSNLQSNRIFLDNSGTLNTNISITSAANRSVASQVLSNAKQSVSNQLTIVSTALDNLESINNNITKSIFIHNEATEEYTNIDYVDSSNKLKEALVSTKSAINAFILGYRIPETILQILN